MIGAISLQNLDREAAFDEGDVRLLSTIASSLSVALENARLIHETRQRVGRARHGQPREPGDLVAARPRRRCRARRRADCARPSTPTSSTWRCIDVDAGLIRFPFYVEDGRREPQDDLPVGTGLTSRILLGREPLSAQSGRGLRGARDARCRDARQVVAGRADPRRRRGDRRHQRPEHEGRGTLRARRRAAALDHRGERRHGHPERAALPRTRSATRSRCRRSPTSGARSRPPSTRPSCWSGSSRLASGCSRRKPARSSWPSRTVARIRPSWLGATSPSSCSPTTIDAGEGIIGGAIASRQRRGGQRHGPRPADASSSPAPTRR